MKLVFFTVGFVMFLVFILPALLALGIRYIPYDIQPRLDNYEKVYRHQSISQNLTGQKDNLSGFALSLKNPLLRNKKNINLTLIDENKTVVRRALLNGSNIQDGEYVKFIFTPISDSKGKNYTFILSAPDVDDNEALAAFYTFNKPDWAGELRIEDRLEPNGSVSFVGLYKPDTIFTTSIDIYSEWLRRFISDALFFLFFVCLILGVAGYTIYISIKETKG